MNSLRKIPGIVICFHKMVGRMIPRLFSASTAIGEFSFHKRLLMWDANKCHTDETVWAHTISLHLCTAIVPDGCTKFIQAVAHVAWNASLKTTMRSHYVTQIITSTKEEEIWEYLLVNCCVIGLNLVSSQYLLNCLRVLSSSAPLQLLLMEVGMMKLIAFVPNSHVQQA